MLVEEFDVDWVKIEVVFVFVELFFVNVVFGGGFFVEMMGVLGIIGVLLILLLLMVV